LVTSALGLPSVSCIAEMTGKRWALVQLSFPTTITREFPFAGLDYLDFPAYNRCSYRLFRSFAWRQVRPDVNRFRGSLGLPPLKQSIFDRAETDWILTCYAVSPALLRRPSDWAAHNLVTGHLTMPASPSHSLDHISQELLEWLKTGEKPIYIGFGSMPIPDPALFIQALGALLRQTSHRYLFCAGWSALPPLPTDPRLFVISSANHQWLFPQCTAAIIHGGVGTLTATLRAGCPTVIVSIFGDQRWWGKWIQNRALGCHLPFKRLSAERLIAAIDSVLSPPITENLAVIAQQMTREDGLQTTTDSLEKYFTRATPIKPR
jgi:sterol 3beta-glucosyltransferase